MDTKLNVKIPINSPPPFLWLLHTTAKPRQPYFTYSSHLEQRQFLKGCTEKKTMVELHTCFRLSNQDILTLKKVTVERQPGTYHSNV